MLSYSAALLDLLRPVELDEEQLIADCSDAFDSVCRDDFLALRADVKFALQALSAVSVPASLVTVDHSLGAASQRLIAVSEQCIAGIEDSDPAAPGRCATSLVHANMQLKDAMSQLLKLIDN